MEKEIEHCTWLCFWIGICKKQSTKKSIALFELGNKTEWQKLLLFISAKAAGETHYRSHSISSVYNKKDGWWLGWNLKHKDCVDKKQSKGHSSVHKENIGQASLKRLKKTWCKTKKLKQNLNKQIIAQSWKGLPVLSKSTELKRSVRWKCTWICTAKQQFSTWKAGFTLH